MSHIQASLDQSEIEFFGNLQSLLLLAGTTEGRRSSRRRITQICAVDAAYGNKGSVVAVATLVAARSGAIKDQAMYSGRCTFPYESGLFYLHEGPFVVRAVRELKEKPQLVCFDAHGLAHPRSAGLAFICGMILGIPSIGVAKSLLVGELVGEGTEAQQRIAYNGMTVGLATGTGGRTRYWSPGYSITMGQLGTLINRFCDVCLDTMALSHQGARKEIRKTAA